MDVKRCFSSDSVVAVQGVCREWAMASQHAPLFVRRYRNPHKDHERGRPPGERGHPPPTEEKDERPEAASETEGFEITV